MSKKKKWIIVSCAAALLAAGTAGAFWAMSGVETRVAFHTPPDGQPLLLEVFHPEKGKRPYPVIMLITQKATWDDTFKSDQRIKQGITAFNGAGYAVVMIQYRDLSAPFPEPIQDMKAAIRWVRTNAKKYRFDPDRIGVSGVMAGGYGACMLATTDAADGFDPPSDPTGDSSVSFRVQAVVAIAPANPPWRDQKEKALPGTYASKDDPPVLLFDAAAASRAFTERMQAAGVPIRLENFPTTRAPTKEELDAMLQQTVSFFDQHLRAGQ